MGNIIEYIDRYIKSCRLLGDESENYKTQYDNCTIAISRYSIFYDAEVYIWNTAGSSNKVLDLTGIDIPKTWYIIISDFELVKGVRYNNGILDFRQVGVISLSDSSIVNVNVKCKGIQMENDTAVVVVCPLDVTLTVDDIRVNIEDSDVLIFKHNGVIKYKDCAYKRDMNTCFCDESFIKEIADAKIETPFNIANNNERFYKIV